MALLHQPPARAPGQKVDFNTIAPPANYVPGLGRGATGFTTRSDIGPARMAPEMPSGLPGKTQEEKRDDDGALDDTKFDEFMGNDAGALASFGEYDQDDREADNEWDRVDDIMDERRRDRREKKLKEELEKYRAANPKIVEQLAPYKRKLAEVTDAEWEAIPEIGDYTIKKHKRMESFVPVPDTLLAKAAAEKDTVSALDARAMSNGLETPGGMATTNLTEIGEGRRTVVSLNLDRMADSVTGQTVVDPKGYLTDLKSIKVSSDAEIGDIKRARTLLKSVISTNPRHAPGWVAAARLEEIAGKLGDARKLIQQGCELCADSEDVWLEAARLQPPDQAKLVLARGVAQLPKSVRIWMQASRLELDKGAQARVLRRALEQVPNSVRLWKAAVELASPDDARILLSRAVECCPQHVELWLALARLESFEQAQKVLNRARKAIPTDATIWFTAAKLRESHGLDEAQAALKDGQPDSQARSEKMKADTAEAVAKIIKGAVKALTAVAVVIDREAWLKEAEAAERGTTPMVATCNAIVSTVVGYSIEDADRALTWKADAADLIRKGSIETARAVYTHALGVFPGDDSIWRAAAQLEKEHGTPEALDALLSRAVDYCPQAEVLWMMRAKEKWLQGSVPAARQILAQGFAANEDSEDIFLAAFKLEFENGEVERARVILTKARQSRSASTPRVWMKSAIIEREAGVVQRQRELLLEGLKKHPDFAKLHLMLGQLEEQSGNAEAARAAYRAGCVRCMGSVALWRARARLEEQAGALGRARALLEQGRLKNPGNEELWLAAVRTEQRAGNGKAAEALMSKALQEAPTSGRLWAEAVMMAPRPQRKQKGSEALKRCDNDPNVVAAVAQLFQAERKIDKARSWFGRAVVLDPDNGDFWALAYALEVKHGTPETAATVLAKCVSQEPHHGERWQRVSKAPANAHLPVDVLLKRVALDIENPPP
ncbi:hypothetical protein WJX73_005268 [Symbiochloris irregularis]|uniref:PRP1 splicing factor N-terminal domain-containing protein n=1 Tax=Symbiochloris irregularis TaxID=706552 RepID=A0AAW1P0L2_9CHLO